MKPRTKAILTGFISALLMLAAVLALPLLMNRTMDSSLSLSAGFAEEAPAEQKADNPPEETRSAEANSPEQAITDKEQAEAAAGKAVPILPTATPSPLPAWPDAPSTPAPGTLIWSDPDPLEEEDDAFPIATLPPFAFSSPGRRALPQSDLYPDWFSIVSRGNAREEFFRQTGNIPLFQKLGIQVPEGRLFSSIVTPDNRLTALESLTGEDQAIQTILHGIFFNLTQENIFLPGDAIAALSGEPVFLAARTQDGLAVYTTGARNLMPLAVMEYALSQGKTSLTHQEYKSARQQLTVGLKNKLLESESQGLNESLEALYQALEKGGEENPKTAFVLLDAQRFIADETWGYLAAGYHLKMVEMSSGKQYTFTVDLISGGLGIAESSQQPFLSIYSSLLSSRGPETEYQEKSQFYQKEALDYLERLTGTPADAWEEQGNQVSISTSYVEGYYLLKNGPLYPETPPAIWEIEIMPRDEQLLALGQAGEPYGTYALALNEEGLLVSYTFQMNPLSGIYSRYVPLDSGTVNKEVEQLHSLASMRGGAQTGSLLRFAYDSRETLVKSVLKDLEKYGIVFRLKSLNSLGLARCDFRQPNITSLNQVLLQATVSDQQGFPYLMEIEVPMNRHPRLLSLSLIGPEPPAPEEK